MGTSAQTSAQARDQSEPLPDLPELQLQSSLPDSKSEYTEYLTDFVPSYVEYF